MVESREVSRQGNSLSIRLDSSRCTLSPGKSSCQKEFRSLCNPHSFDASGDENADKEKLATLFRTALVELARDFFGPAGMGGNGGRAYSPERALMWLKAFWVLVQTVKEDREYREILLKISWKNAENKCSRYTWVKRIFVGGTAVGGTVLVAGCFWIALPVAATVGIVGGTAGAGVGGVTGSLKETKWERRKQETAAGLNLTQTRSSGGNTANTTAASTVSAPCSSADTIKATSFGGKAAPVQHRPVDRVMEALVLDVFTEQILLSECGVPGGGGRCRADVVGDFQSFLQKLEQEDVHRSGGDSDILRPLVHLLAQ